MSELANIIKRVGQYQTYDQQKLYNSVRSACLAVHTPQGEAEFTADLVARAITPWLKLRDEITSLDIRHHAADLLKTYNPDAAYLYLHHRIIE